MQRTLTCLLAFGLVACAPLHAAKEILLQFAPEEDAPVIAKITATDRVILDAAPAPRNAEQGWRQLALPTPFEGYVPVATIDKSMSILEGTPVHYLPTASSARITNVENADRYEIVRAQDEWATVRFYKNITGYFLNTEEAPELDLSFATTQVPLVQVEPAAEPIAAPAPISVPAPQARINPDEPISQLDPDAMPDENVIWRPATNAATIVEEAQASPVIEETASPSELSGIIVSSSNTQARESTPDFGPAKTPRLLTGILAREITTSGPSYPIRLKSPEGRLIAYVDFSGIYIPDLSPYINQRVYLRGEVHPLPGNSSELVILAHEIRLAESN